MEIADTIKDMQWQMLLIKRKLRKKIRSLPDNPKINRLGHGCFTIMASEIFKDKDTTFSAEYYDFKYQYRVMSKKIRLMNITNIKKNIKNWIKTGYINRSESFHRLTHNRMKLHPQVIEYLKEIL